MTCSCFPHSSIGSVGVYETAKRKGKIWMQECKGRDSDQVRRRSQGPGRGSCLEFSGADVARAAAPALPALPPPLPEMLFQAEAPSFIFHKMLSEVFGAC